MQDLISGRKPVTELDGESVGARGAKRPAQVVPGGEEALSRQFETDTSDLRISGIKVLLGYIW